MSKSKTAIKVNSQPQAEKFKAMAKEVGADGSEASFDKLLKKVAKPSKKAVSKK